MDLSVFYKPEYNIHLLDIHSYEVGSNWELTIPSLFNYFQEIAWEHAAILGFGMQDLSRDGLFWALSRVRVEISNLPKWTDKVTLVTYPSGIDGLFALRDYELYSEEGEPLAMGSSSWLILSHSNRKPIRTAEYMAGKKYVKRRSMSGNAAKVDLPDNQEEYYSKQTVKPYDIDVNHHVNNVRYIEWAMNSFDFEFINQHKLSLIEVNFLAEGLPGNNLYIERRNNGDLNKVVKITREDDLKELCRLRLNWTVR